MTSVADEREAMDLALEYQERWWGLEVTGYTILFFTAIPVVFVFVGLRVGSWFWLWCTGVLGLVGLALTGTAAVKRVRAEEAFQVIGERLRERLGPPSPGPESFELERERPAA